MFCKVIKYIRYADDFILGVKGDKADCERIKRQLSDFISQTLKMELSEQKTLITHSNQYARFLGYDIRVRRDQKLKPHGNHVSRTLNGSVELCIPFADKIMPFLFGKSVIRQLRDGTIEPTARKYIFRCTDLEIVSTYNSELLNIDGKGHAQPETVVAKSARPSVLDSLKRPVPPRSPEKKSKQHEEVR